MKANQSPLENRLRSVLVRMKMAQMTGALENRPAAVLLQLSEDEETVRLALLEVARLRTRLALLEPELPISDGDVSRETGGVIG
jgi:hypothetical protein